LKHSLVDKKQLLGLKAALTLEARRRAEAPLFHGTALVRSTTKIIPLSWPQQLKAYLSSGWPGEPTASLCSLAV
jgi:hypothetical protein